MKKHTGYQVKHHTANHKKYRKLSKTAAVVGSTVTAVSVAAPLMPAVNVQADTVQYSSASSQQQFINQIAPHAQSVANANDLYASVMMAQAILESAWGQSTLAQAPNYNLFGIKGSYNGQTVYMDTLEFLNGQWVTKNEPFRRYPSYAESFMDNARTLRTVSFQSGVYYYAGAWKSNTTSYRDATAWLTGRYATDPNYATSLNRIIETYGLTRYDTASNGTPSTVIGGGISSENNAGVVNNPSQSTGNLGGSTYTVSVGDTLWAISRKFGVTITQLKSWNNLSSDMIYVGQKLSIQTGTGNTAVTPTPSTPGVSNNPTTSNAQTYTVVAGDSVWKIAHQFGISMDTLRSLNNIQNNFIYPGQVLKIRIISSNNVTTPTPESTPSIPTGSQTSTQTPTNQTSDTIYTVKSGDSLWAIANKHGLSVSQLKSINHLTSDIIYPGQKLNTKTKVSSQDTVSSSTTKPAPSQESITSSNTSTSTSKTYTVASGDSLWAIANKHGLSVSQLKNMNGLTSDIIYPGQTLKVGQGNNTSTTAPSKIATTTPAPSQVSTTSSNTSTSTSKTYTVASGDSLWAIANKHGLSVSQLKNMNGLTSDVIYPGQTLKVGQGNNTSTTAPSKIATTTPAPSQVPTTSSNTSTSTSKTYTVASGDSLWAIANKHGLSVSQLKNMNGLTSDVIYPGQTLKVGQGNNTSTTAPSKIATTTPAPSQVSTTSSNTSTSTSKTYTVASGDSLWAIANKHGLSVSQLKNMNGLTSDVIYPGQTLKVGQGNNTSTTAPSKIATTTPAPSQVPTTSSNTSTSTSKTYTVASGDSLWAIANKHGLSVSQLKNMNGLTSDVIYPGQTLKVGQGNNTSTTAPSKIATTTPAPSQVSTTSSNTSTSTSKTYTVASGDSLWAIANKHGLSVSQLKNMNGLTSDVIYPGKQLLVSQTSNSSATVNLISLNTTNTNSSSNNLNRAAIVAEANKHIGKPYAWGAKGPDSFDCSGYTRYVFLQVTGRDIGSNTVAQEKAGTIISVDQAKAGDLYFWGSQGSSYHVAIALGNGSYIYASEPGDFVKIGSVANFAPDFAVRM